VPRSRQPARAVGPARAAVGLAVILAAAAIGYLATRSSPIVTPRQTICGAGAKTDQVQLSAGQAGIAATIAGVASQRSMPVRAVAIAYATALQESKLSNPDYGDRDSVGVFQQRPSEGWGTAHQIEDPVYASSRFFAALAQVPHYRRIPIEQAAQAVQHSADGTAYSQYAAEGTTLAKAFAGVQPHAVWCEYTSDPGKTSLAAAGRSLTAAFGPLARHTVSHPAVAAASHKASHGAGDPAMTVAVSGTQQGWAIAGWLVAHAASYGIRDITYLDYKWAGFTGSGEWTRLPARHGAQPGPTIVTVG
jgi:hypothetical protein